MIKGALLTTANILSKPLYQGNLINNRYEIIEFLGRGSYGNSYLVFDREKESHVVLKLLRKHKMVFKAGMNSFIQEQKILHSLNYRYFPTFYEKGEFRGTPFYTMEFVRGRHQAGVSGLAPAPRAPRRSHAERREEAERRLLEAALADRCPPRLGAHDAGRGGRGRRLQPRPAGARFGSKAGLLHALAGYIGERFGQQRARGAGARTRAGRRSSATSASTSVWPSAAARRGRPRARPAPPPGRCW